MITSCTEVDQFLDSSHPWHFHDCALQCIVAAGVKSHQVNVLHVNNNVHSPVLIAFIASPYSYSAPLLTASTME